MLYKGKPINKTEIDITRKYTNGLINCFILIDFCARTGTSINFVKQSNMQEFVRKMYTRKVSFTNALTISKIQEH